MNIAEFLDMGGYAMFVWPSLILTAVVLVANWVAARRMRTAALTHAQRRARADAEEATAG